MFLKQIFLFTSTGGGEGGEIVKKNSPSNLDFLATLLLHTDTVINEQYVSHKLKSF
jgi:hypothetical protein